MTHIRSGFAHTLGGVVLAVGLVAGLGCTGSRSWRVQDVMPWVPTEPATQIVSAFNPQVQHLPDPSKDGQMGAGLSGQLYMIAAGGKFTEANGDLYIMADDITARPPGQTPAVTEIWHFDPVTLRKLRTKDERFGDCYALFLPYPPTWKDVTHIRISTQYKPKGDPTKEPTLSSPPQTVTLDFTPPGEQPSVWLDKSGPKPTAPVAMKAMPNVARDIARGLGSPHTGPQPNGTVNAGGPLPTSPVTPAGGTPPFALPPTGITPPPPTTPLLPPPMTFTPDRPQATMRGPNGETLNVTAMALPPGQSVPPGWTKQPDGSIQPPAVVANQQHQSQSQQTWPAQGGQTTQVNYQPPPTYVPASQQYVPASQQPQYQSRIQHGAFNQTQPLPPLPPTAVPPARTALPPVGTVPGNVPALPTTPSGVSGPVMPMNLPPTQPQFDPNSPVGGWATQPPVAPVPPPPPGGGYAPPVAPPPATSYDAPLIPAVIRPGDRR